MSSKFRPDELRSLSEATYNPLKAKASTKEISAKNAILERQQMMKT